LSARVPSAAILAPGSSRRTATLPFLSIAQGGAVAPRRPRGYEPARRSESADAGVDERGNSQRFYDLVILSSKSYDLQASIDDFAPAMGPELAVLPLLNGLRHLDVLDARFGAQRVLGGLARISSTLDADGRIHHLGAFNALAFGSRGGPPAHIDDIADALRVPGFDAHLSADILHEMWEKWVFIAAAAATTSLMRATVGDIVARRCARTSRRGCSRNAAPLPLQTASRPERRQ